MEDYKEIQKEIKKLRETKAKLEEQKKSLNNAEEELVDFATECATFDEIIIYSIRLLLRAIEDKDYYTIIYTKNVQEINQGNFNNMEEVCIGIADNKNLSKFICENKKDISELFEKKQAYELLIKEKKFIPKDNVGVDNYIYTYSYDDEYYQKYADTITFGFLLSEAGINSTGDANYSRYNFYDKPYIQDFIRYVFNLQVQKGGMKLTRHEIWDAYKEYISCLITKKEALNKEYSL